MDIYLFVSDSTPSVRAFTPDRTGANLPATYAPWRLGHGGRPVVVELTDPVVQAVTKKGLFLIGGGGPRQRII